MTFEYLEIGSKGDNGSLLGISPFLDEEDYSSKESFKGKLSSYLKAAERRGWIGRHTTAVFPEYVGTWLFLAGKDRRYSTFYDATSGLSGIGSHNIFDRLCGV